LSLDGIRVPRAVSCNDDPAWGQRDAQDTEL